MVVKMKKCFCFKNTTIKYNNNCSVLLYYNVAKPLFLSTRSVLFRVYTLAMDKKKKN